MSDVESFSYKEIAETLSIPVGTVTSRLIRVFWHGRPGAYLLVSKGAHKISLFIFESLPSLGSTPQMTIDEWSANGLTYVAVGDVSRDDLEMLRRAYGGEGR